MRPHVDPTRCRGYGVCHEIADRHFATDDWGLAWATNGPSYSADRTAVDAAIAACPFDAIRWIDTADQDRNRSD
ncbi:ferredoxin [Nocardioides alcanivorans]|uniref:ferredoxin n=1 Tax=Nocardioides alcanivorans TaxID=2897352 RepID=UPI0035DC1EAB